MHEERVDAVVIGSGAGGSVTAFRLGRAGARTVVLERGRRLPPEAQSHDELAMLANLYKEGGAQLTADLDLLLLQGSVVGGSTVLTNGVCFRVPESVRRRWATQGFALGRGELQTAYERIEAALGVRPMSPVHLNPGTEPAVKGFEALGLDVQRFHKNLRGCLGCGYCNMGCPYGRKQDAARTWIPWAEAAGVDVRARHEVLKLEARRGRIQAVVARDLERDETVRLRAERVVLAGGAIGSPELLLRSRLGGAAAGRRMGMHVGSILVAEMDEPIDAFLGDQMGWWHKGDGFALEQVHNPPMTFALTVPGRSELHHERTGRYRHLTSAGVLVPTPMSARVVLGRLGRLAKVPRADVLYKAEASVVAALRRGFDRLARVYLAGGARRVFVPLHQGSCVEHVDELPAAIARIRRPKDVPGLGTAHPQGGAVAGDEARTSVVDASLQVHGVQGLYVVDASVFPSCVEVNPQLTVMAVADAVSTRWGLPPSEPPMSPAPSPARALEVEREEETVCSS